MWEETKVKVEGSQSKKVRDSFNRIFAENVCGGSPEPLELNGTSAKTRLVVSRDVHARPEWDFHSGAASFALGWSCRSKGNFEWP